MGVCGRACVGVGVGAWAQVCRGVGVGVGVGVGMAVFSWAYVRASGCPGARAHGCVGVCVCVFS